MKVLAVISARGGSKGVPGKNIRKLGGALPLVAYMITKAKKSPLIDKVICSTDSPEIAEVARSYGAEIPFLREQHQAADRTPLIESTKYAMQKMDELGYRADVVAQFAPTSPFILQSNIDESVRLVVEKGIDCAVSLKRIEHEHPYRARIVDKDGFFENFIKDVNVEAIHSRQDLPPLYCTSGGIYVRKRSLLENFDGSDFALGKVRKGIILDDIESINIDRMIDLEFAEFMMTKKELLAKYLL